jgi:hypothetical protein
MGQMSNRSSNRREMRILGSFRDFAHRQEVLGSFRNFAHRQEAVGSFRKSLPSALQSSVYEISEIGQAVSPAFELFRTLELRFRSGCGRVSSRSLQSGL